MNTVKFTVECPESDARKLAYFCTRFITPTFPLAPVEAGEAERAGLIAVRDALTRAGIYGTNQ